MTQQPYQQYPPMPQGPPPGYPQQTPGGYQHNENSSYGPVTQQPAGPPPPAQWQGYGAHPAQQGPPPPVQHQAAPGEDEFATPAPPRPAGGESPALKQLKDRLLLIWPKKFDPQAKNFAGDGTEELIEAEVIVCDGPPIDGNINGQTEAFTPFAAGPKMAPFFTVQFFRNAPVDRLRDLVPGGPQYGRPCLARLVYRPSAKGKPWPDLVDPTDADKALARTILPRRAELRAAAEPVQQPQPDSFTPPAGQGPPPAWAQAPQGPPPGYAPAQPYPQQPPAPYGQPGQGGYPSY